MDDRTRVRDDSDELMSALAKLKDLELDRRTADISTPHFHKLADAVEQQARHVYDVALHESFDGNRARTSNIAIEEVAPSDRSSRAHASKRAHTRPSRNPPALETLPGAPRT